MLENIEGTTKEWRVKKTKQKTRKMSNTDPANIGGKHFMSKTTAEHYLHNSFIVLS